MEWNGTQFPSPEQQRSSKEREEGKEVYFSQGNSARNPFVNDSSL